MKVLKAATNGLDQAGLIKVFVDHQWLGPKNPKHCLCGKWRSPQGAKNNVEAHANHVATVILEEL